MYINAWYLLVNSLAHFEVSESWVKTHTLIQTILETCILVITKSPWGVLGFSVAWGRGDGFNPVETCLAASWICSQMCCRDENNFTRFLIQCFIQFHLLLLWTSITILFWFVWSCTVAWNVYLHIQSSQSILFNTFFLLNLFLPNASSCWSPTPDRSRGTGHTPECSATGHWRARGSLCCDQLEEGRLMNPIGPSSRQRNVNSFGFSAWKPWQNQR